MKSSWMFLCGLTVSLALVSTLHATRQYYSIHRCQCNNRSKYCLPDAFGLHCLDCQGNTEGRHCERCKVGFYLQGAELHCTACNCNPTGSVDGTCDSRGRCRCKEGVKGHKCDHCEDGPIGANGCTQRRQVREDSGSLTSPCFCYGHSSQCSPRPGYSVHNITSTFTNGPDDWKVATVQGITPHNTHFRWTPKHQDLEVLSKNSLPIYLYAPESYLGNRLLSYGQNFSFSLRLDRGVRHPSTNDVILEGAGLRVGASLGELRFIIPCGKKINYSFRLDEQAGSKWRPQLSSAQFKTLLQNLTAVKIRATFGENGRGYIDNVKMVSAKRGDGVPAHWVHICSCPTGYEGDFCEHCSAGFRRSSPSAGAFSPCEECSCSGGLCDPLTGDCYSGDQTPADRTCSPGFYSHHRRPDLCLPCPCPQGVSCWLPAGVEEPLCERCPPGSTGSRCDICQEGFYGDPSGASGLERSCRPCQCNGHIDPTIEGSCDRSSGECLKCLNNTEGRSCEACVRGFYHSRATDACKPCGCDAQRSEGDQCDEQGRCLCKAGFEGLRCQRSSCPACFSPIKAKLEAYAEKLKELEALDGGVEPANKAEMEAALRKAEEAVNDLQDDAELLTELEKKLQGRVASVSRSQLAEGQVLQNIADEADAVDQQQQTYRAEVKDVQSLLKDMKRKLEEAKNNLLLADIPAGDSPLGSDFLSSLVKTATSLAGTHETTAEAVENAATGALSDSQKGLDLIRGLMSRENKVKELVGDLKNKYDQSSAQVKGLENEAKGLSEEAKDESKKADSMLKDITTMERNIPSPLKDAIDAMLSRVEGVKTTVDDNIADIEALQEDLDQGKVDSEDLLAKGEAAKKKGDQLLNRVYTAKADTEGALQHLNRHTTELDGVLNTLRGFDRQIDSNKALADAAIKRLPGINSTIQQAVRNNAKTLSLLGDVSEDYNKALGTVTGLEKLVEDLEGSLPTQGDVLNEASKLNTEAQDLKTKAVSATEALSKELKDTKEMEAEADNVADEAAAAFTHARQTKAAVGKALQDIRTMLANMNQPGAVDEGRLKQLEVSLANAQRDVESQLRPRLRNMEELEAVQRRRLAGIDVDLDTILADISNLEDILRSIPKGCFNSPPIEEA